MSDCLPHPKWPNVPACYEWLSLDQRGAWRLQGERVSHRGLIDFLNQHYAVDAQGHWFVQNGPQRVFVDLACTPWIFRQTAQGFVSHTGRPAGCIRHLYLDDTGRVLLDCELGIGLLDDRDLAALLDACRDAHGGEASEEAFATLLAGQEAGLIWQTLPLQPMTTVDLEKRFNFVRQPRP